MKLLPDFFQLEKYSISPADVIRMTFQCDPDVIQSDVILMPWWQPGIYDLWVDSIATITEDMVFEVVYDGKPISIIRSGIGAPQTGDIMLALGCTACERVVFAGSVGGLREDIRVGDLMIPEFSYCGDGYSRYLEPGFPPKDCFLDRAAPNLALSLALSRSVNRIAQEAGIPVHSGPVFSIDCILAQFSKLDDIIHSLGCIGIEMETAAVFKAAGMVGIQATALFSVSDVCVINKSLYSGRTEEEKEHRRVIRKQVLAKAVLDSFDPLDESEK